MKVFQGFLHIAVWGIAYYFLAPEPVGLGLFKVPFFNNFHTLPFFSYGVLLNLIMVYTYAHLALPPYFVKKSYQYFAVINFSFLVGFVLLESGMDYFYMKYIYANFEYADERLTSFADWITANLIVSSLTIIGANFYGFSFAWIREQTLRGQLEQEKLKAELSALKHQVNPHFLFNVLNSLYGLSLKNDDEETAKGIMQLSEMMRYILYEANDDKVRLDKELIYLKNYISLQKLRLNKETEIEFTIEGESNDKLIAPMILIPFVENACKHGVSTVFASEIYIFIKIEGNTLYLNVRNPIHPKNEKLKQDAGGIGLKNVEKRLDLYYPQSHNLSIDDDGKEYSVQLILAI
ncbi:MAG: histidine kinase [Bacteroidota bacterium]